RTPGRPLHPPPGCVTAVARDVLRLARAGRLRRGAQPAALAPPSRAPDLLPRGDADVVAGHPRAVLRRREGRVRLRGVRARLAARPAARAGPASCVRLLQGRAPALGTVRFDRPADRRRVDGGRTGDRLLRRVRPLLPALPAHGADRRRVQRKPEMSAPPPTTSAEAATRRSPSPPDRRSTSMEISTAHSDSVATSGATTVTRPRSNAEYRHA